ncbi:MAG: tetratricopeptide repeat protein [Chitinophagales bacterium]
MKKGSIILFFVLIAVSAMAQRGRDEVLAKSYMQNGEFDKAVELYRQLWENNNQAPNFYTPLLQGLMELKRFDEAEKTVKKQAHKFPENPQYDIDLGLVFKSGGDGAKAKEVWDKVVKNIKPSETAINTAANAFKVNNLPDYEIAVYDKATKLFKGNIDYSLPIAAAYFNKGDNANAARFYIDNLERQPQNQQQVKSVLQQARGAEKLLAEMETQLYAKIQKQPENEQYIEFLTWIYIQNKDFEGAIVQMKALDKRKKDNGFRVLEVARMAQTEGFYDEAISGFNYVTSKEPRSNLYFQAKTELLNCRKEKMAKNITSSPEELNALRGEYESFLSENGKTPRTAQSMKEMADLLGFYIHDNNAAMQLCDELVHMPGIPQNLKNQAKLSLGDFYLIGGDVWESTLLYSQVDKEEKDAPLGEEARFKNAKLSYFKGDFDWAQEQLKVLKASTSELISNDAINLSVFIIDNLGLDTIPDPMERFARAELLLFQNKNEAAAKTLDTITYLYPGHALFDDIEYTKAVLYVKAQEYQKAIPLLEDIIKNFGKDLKGDDATFLLAEINERELHNTERAKELYKSILTDYPSSLLTIEARKRFRVLRGDKLE